MAITSMLLLKPSYIFVRINIMKPCHVHNLAHAIRTTSLIYEDIFSDKLLLFSQIRILETLHSNLFIRYA